MKKRKDDIAPGEEVWSRYQPKGGLAFPMRRGLYMNRRAERNRILKRHSPRERKASP